MSQRTLHDVYLRPWKEYLQAGGRGAMLAHNSINDVPAHANAPLMSLFRDTWAKSPGILLASDMCDVGLLAHPTDAHMGFGVAPDLKGAGVLAMSAGLDQELCNPDDGRGQSFTLIADAVAKHEMDSSVLDRATANVLRASGILFQQSVSFRVFYFPPHRWHMATISLCSVPLCAWFVFCPAG